MKKKIRRRGIFNIQSINFRGKKRNRKWKRFFSLAFFINIQTCNHGRLSFLSTNFSCSLTRKLQERWWKCRKYKGHELSYRTSRLDSFLYEPRPGARFDIDFNFSKARFCRRSPSELTQSTCDKSRFIKKNLIAHVRYNKLLTWLRGFRDIPIKATYSRLNSDIMFSSETIKLGIVLNE